ncbi:40S ribosomal protein RPS15A [Emiliania huxleyi CCMP1516]|uniref:Uncharacterized protein n=2 Tax=Emiliania huxleyi TaxID=2903 RepID=A0A0D3KK95_EMIH1|nr:40S ribosomal protein RPS15A [Emiliania huxleyi CCMP1516]EOD36180.1 40S ribosomal protein RPS15A [Emiliania huxleyi CCMP1516]|eukprot:XP_005788609.1 40S ribosomal protein RPS15A [Emiliania huxleyi CCMP1516]
MGGFKIGDDPGWEKIGVELMGRFKKGGVIWGSLEVSQKEMEKGVVNLGPADQLGIMDHEEARRKHTGGKVLGFFY